MVVLALALGYFAFDKFVLNPQRESAVLTRFYGVFAPNSKYRAKVTPARRGNRKKYHSADDTDQTQAHPTGSMSRGSIKAILPEP